jgi:hypothetical protein
VTAVNEGRAISEDQMRLIQIMLEQFQPPLGGSDGAMPTNESGREPLSAPDAVTPTPLPRRQVQVEKVRTANTATTVLGSVVKTSSDLPGQQEEDITISNSEAIDNGLQIHGNVIGFSIRELRGDSHLQHRGR